MNVEQLIEKLQSVEDKTMPVYVYDDDKHTVFEIKHANELDSYFEIEIKIS